MKIAWPWTFRCFRPRRRWSLSANVFRLRCSRRLLYARPWSGVISCIRQRGWSLLNFRSFRPFTGSWSGIGGSKWCIPSSRWGSPSPFGWYRGWYRNLRIRW